ncbi:bifunctional tetrahydrofolate synthase/dihydrofolate synthase [Halopseudomonas salegens]|uniref:Dihydrofolate synthase/folylpolyglutamate synthase n=1 Tax=Halopseudomonas salegens TaxID=1434072 RepID=A0A1H2F2I5_9GAMM|nr:bifunctional tetrahydrofolate synthase/dihydrofolate synthase [Halopseudomonas salegens]SDU01525.1 dihydrofolate synthase / folylpolyglutamate synthase [Halopseudomonas salegens]
MPPSTLADWLARLEQLHPKEIDMGLQRVSQVARRLGVLQPAPLVVTVSGTNGKGSTCAAVHALLQAAGQHAGCYSSPHLIHYNERVRIGDQFASDEQLCAAFASIEAVRGDVSLTYFEFGTLAALLLFQRAELDAVVLEVGLGGRLDAVNVVDADIAIVTSIGLDHQQYLGDSRDSVGYEKAGIARAGRPLICGETDLPSRFISTLSDIGPRVYQRGRELDWQPQGDEGDWQVRVQDRDGAEHTIGPLPPVDLPRDNLLLAIQASVLAGCRLSTLQISQALQPLRLPGRMDWHVLEWRDQPRRLCLDVGHNPHAAAWLAKTLARHQHPVRAVFSALDDKDVVGIVRALRGCFVDWALAPLPSPRSRSPGELQQLLDGQGETAHCHVSVVAAISAQLDADDQSAIMVFGSFYTVAAALEWLASEEKNNG